MRLSIAIPFLQAARERERDRGELRINENFSNVTTRSSSSFSSTFHDEFTSLFRNLQSCVNKNNECSILFSCVLSFVGRICSCVPTQLLARYAFLTLLGTGSEKEGERERKRIRDWRERQRGNRTMECKTCFYSAEKPVSAPTYGSDSHDYLNEWGTNANDC